MKLKMTTLSFFHARLMLRGLRDQHTSVHFIDCFSYNSYITAAVYRWSNNKHLLTVKLCNMYCIIVSIITTKLLIQFTSFYFRLVNFALNPSYIKIKDIILQIEMTNTLNCTKVLLPTPSQSGVTLLAARIRTRQKLKNLIL